MGNKKHILFLGSKKKVRVIRSRFPDFVFHKYFPKYSFVATGDYDADYLNTQLDRLDDYFSRYPIAGVVYTRDVDAVMASILNDRYDLCGPSVESVFLSAHKYYTRKKTADMFEVTSIPLDNLSQLKSLSYPVFLKPPHSALGRFAMRVESEAVARQFLREHADLIRRSDAPFRALYAGTAITAKYPEAARSMVLAERSVDQFEKQVTVEGFVQGGEVKIYAVVDSHLSRTQEFESFTLPTELSECLCAQLEAKAAQDVASLGLDDTTFNAEYWIISGAPVLLEINPRSAFSFVRLYKEVLGIDIYEFVLNLALGKKITVTSSGGAHECGGQFNLLATKNGLAKNLFDFTITKPQNMRVFKKPDDYVEKQGQFGRNMARVNLFGESRGEIKAEAKRIRRKFLKKPQ